jgi:hypothetical protein
VARVSRRRLVGTGKEVQVEASSVLDLSVSSKLLEDYYEQVAKLMLTSFSIGAGLSYVTVSKSEPKLEDAGIRFGTTGWRLWEVRGHTLWSVGMRDRAWYPGEPMVGDPDHASGAQGVYAFRDPAHAYEMFQDVIYSRTHVLGTVKMWGRYVEHERGYRAEFARITSLIVGPRVNLDALRVLYLNRRCPESLTPVVELDGRVVGVTTLTPGPLAGHRNNRPSPVSVLEPPQPLISHYGIYEKAATVRYQTHIWDGRRLVLEPDQDPRWLPGWLPLVGDVAR